MSASSTAGSRAVPSRSRRCTSGHWAYRRASPPASCTAASSTLRQADESTVWLRRGGWTAEAASMSDDSRACPGLFLSYLNRRCRGPRAGASSPSEPGLRGGGSSAAHRDQGIQSILRGVSVRPSTRLEGSGRRPGRWCPRARVAFVDNQSQDLLDLDHGHLPVASRVLRRSDGRRALNSSSDREHAKWSLHWQPGGPIPMAKHSAGWFHPRGD